jgi:alkylated DNA repair dioxygenase AlkB
MNTLFAADTFFPEGFSYYPAFITREEEQNLLEIIKQTELHSFLFQGYEAKRKVASFGFDWNFEKRILTKGKNIPAVFDFLIQKVAERIPVSIDAFAELLITEYPPESVINWHRDAPPFDVIAGISLLSDCTFRLRPYDKAKQKRNAIISLIAERRSLYVIQGSARKDWEHSITPVKTLRYSITLRSLKA